MTDARFTRRSVISAILRGKPAVPREVGTAYAPANVALCKYWGKRDVELNLPLTSSLSISLGSRGTHTTLTPADVDRVVLNGRDMDVEDPFAHRLFNFLDLFRTSGESLLVETENSVPTAAGIASSASGFAALVMAMNALYDWNLAPSDLSVLARMGSGSACRSIFEGFVLWEKGMAEDGMDSCARRLPVEWPELRVGLLILETGKKPIGSTEGMNRTVDTSILYRSWPDEVKADLTALKSAIDSRDFDALGAVSERNALAMHATMLAASPPVVYWLPRTVEIIQRVHELRRDGLDIYLTMDAGPNVKLLFRSKDETTVVEEFSGLVVCDPFTSGDG